MDQAGVFAVPQTVVSATILPVRPGPDTLGFAFASQGVSLGLLEWVGGAISLRFCWSGWMGGAFAHADSFGELCIDFGL